VPPTPDIDKRELLRQLGFAGDMSLYETALREADLSRPEKRRISEAKRERVREVLEARFLRVCARGDCQSAGAALDDQRTRVAASEQGFCEVCGGSADRAALAAMTRACALRGVRRLCIVGGSPAVRERLLRALEGSGLELRLIDGTASHSLKSAEANTAWAQLVLIWGSTELDHKVSLLYRGPKVVQIARRGVQELARAVVKAVGG
jgi:hypothetical protein